MSSCILPSSSGHEERRDVSHVLRSQAYWPSYNSPYFKKIFNLSGNKVMVDKYGDWFSYDKTPRAKIFRRDHGKVKDIDSMTRCLKSSWPMLVQFMPVQ